MNRLKKSTSLLSFQKQHSSRTLQCNTAYSDASKKINNFAVCREVDGNLIVGEVKEKEKAKIAYDAAKSRGLSAGHVAER